MDYTYFKHIKKSYALGFLVGLLDADGGIHVNHWRKKNLQFRIVIKLKYLEPNKRMLNFLAKKIGIGTVRINRVIGKPGYKTVTWVVDDRNQIKKFLPIFKKYTPQTSRVQAQLAFLEKWIYIRKPDMNQYFIEREQKYQNVKINKTFLDFKKIPHWNGWFSGFIEGEGCFSARKSRAVFGFSVAQNNNYCILDAIRSFLNNTNKIRLIGKKFFHFEVCKR